MFTVSESLHQYVPHPIEHLPLMMNPLPEPYHSLALCQRQTQLLVLEHYLQKILSLVSKDQSTLDNVESVKGMKFL